LGLCSNGEGKGSEWSKQGPQETHTPTKIVPSFSERKQQHTTTATFRCVPTRVSFIHLSVLKRGMGGLGLGQKSGVSVSDTKIKKTELPGFRSSAFLGYKWCRDPCLEPMSRFLPSSSDSRVALSPFPHPHSPRSAFSSATAPLSSIRLPRQARLLLSLIANRLFLPPFPALHSLNVLDFDITPSVLFLLFLLTRHLHVRFCPIVKYRHLPARTADAKPNRSSKDHPTRPHLQAFRLAP
jgi:hypothetical protein